MPFVHLHVHSEYSSLSGTSSLEDLCETARSQGAEFLALTDTNGLYGAVRFLEIARHYEIKPILGTELRSGGRRAVLLVKNAEGYANLCRLLSLRHCEPSFDFTKAVSRHREGLIILSDDGPSLKSWKENSPQDLYIEVSPGERMNEALGLSRALELPPVATNRVRLRNPEEFALHRLLRAIALNTTLSRLPPSVYAQPHQWFAGADFMERYYPNVPEALANTRRIAESCATDLDFNRTLFPKFRELPDRLAAATLREKTYAGARRRYGKITHPIKSRIEHELGIIRQRRFAHYFLLVEEIVRQSPITCGRGSAAAAIVAYCLGITHVDPLRHGLFFERFLNASRNDPPDVDIDFPWDERDGIFSWLFTRHGAGRVAMVANYNTLGLRGALREIAKVYGMAPAEIGRHVPRILRRLDLMRLSETPGSRSWGEALCREARLKEPWPQILAWAARAQGCFRHLSLHCGGVVIVPDEIRKYVPVEISAKGLPVIQWEKEQAEDAGLVKIDLLGNRSLSVIRDALAAVEQNSGERLDYASWDPIGDEKTRELIRDGDTVGCFYIESPATRLLLNKLWGGAPASRVKKMEEFAYLIKLCSLVRPAALSFAQTFIRRAHGESHEPLHPALEPFLRENHGVLLYQEDVTRAAMALAGFSLAKAEQLRKVLSKKRNSLTLRDYRDRFYQGALARGVPPAVIEAVWSMILSFVGYSFCKPHAASYAQVSFRCAYLKVHHPAEFMAAVISNEGGYYPTSAYLSESRRLGLQLLPPDINASQWAYTGSGRTIRVGLMQIKSIERGVADRVIAERRKEGPFRSFDDFRRRVRLEQAQLRLLIKAGCFDSLSAGLTRPALLWRTYVPGGTKLPVPPDYPESRKIQQEIETLGLLVSRHPLELYRLEEIECVPAREMSRHVGRMVQMVGWLITEKLTQTKRGEAMEFATFEDATALYEATFFADVYRRFWPLLVSGRPYLLRGIVEQSFGAVTLTIRHIEHLDGRVGGLFTSLENPASSGARLPAAGNGSCLEKVLPPRKRAGETPKSASPRSEVTGTRSRTAGPD